MSSSTGFASPSGASGADTFRPRPLSAIAATGGGGVPQTRIARVLADLVEPLSALHERGRVHAAISTHTIGLDEAGVAHLLAPPSDPRADAETVQRTPGFAAFEQYSDDPELAGGPWTDIYALSAVACSLITGSAPPDALARRVRDDYVPLVMRAPQGYDESFLRGIDAGLALLPAARPRSMTSFAELLGLPAKEPEKPAPLAVPVVAAAKAATMAALPAPATDRRGSRAPIFSILIVLAVVALAGFFWLRSGKTPPLDARSVAPPQSTASAGAAGGQASGAGSAPAPSATPGQAPQAASGSAAPAPGAPAASGSRDAGSGSTSAPAQTAASTQPAAGSADAGAAQAPAGSLSSTPSDATLPAASPSSAQPSAAAGAPSTSTATPAVQPGGTLPGLGAAQPVSPAGAVPMVTTASGGAGSRSTGGAAAAAQAPKGPPVPVNIDVRPWGEIVVDGVSRGVSPPLKELRLAPGKHTVTVRNAGLPSYTQTLEIKSGQRAATIAHVFQ